MAGHEPVEADGVQSLEEAVEVDTPRLSHNKAFIVDGPTMGLDTVTSLLGQSLVLHLSAEDMRTLAAQTGMTNKWLSNQGLISARDLWISFHYKCEF